MGLIGTGFMSCHFAMALDRVPGIRLSKVLTNRSLTHCTEYPRQELLTQSIQEVIDRLLSIFL